MLIAVLIVSCSKDDDTSQNQLIPNGDFEMNNDITEHWYFKNAFLTVNKITDSIAKSGNSCFYNYTMPDWMPDSQGEGGIITSFEYMRLKVPLDLEINRSYKFSAWIRAKGKINSIYDNQISGGQERNSFFRLNFGIEAVSENENILIDTGWVYISKTFSVTENGPMKISAVMETGEFWMDDLKLIKL
ncbi:hypothetical protein [Aquimarina sp. AU474]|uniref:hypothetical protein n=1 Tax=Aquimarina sp. AU474 TaxID=2108529 RepID=UPI000D69F89C|nr:hypothetical protein [Aquimarina sp. AU474]